MEKKRMPKYSGPALSAPGMFICCNILAGDMASFSDLNEKQWRRLLTEQGFELPEVDKILNNYHYEDSPISVKSHRELLTASGFIQESSKEHNKNRSYRWS